MRTARGRSVFFSPTHTTRCITEALARGTGLPPAESLNLTPVAGVCEDIVLAGDELAVIGVPVYSGRVPVQALERLPRIRGQRTPAIAVVVYGNRDYDDALLELRDVCEEQRFLVVAAAAFIGEHSFSSSRTPIAPGRPDACDLDTAVALGRQVRRYLWRTPAEALTTVSVPGTRPYKPRSERAPLAPTTDTQKCTRCGECIPTCPVDAISLGDGIRTDPESCILCCACLRACPEQARSLNDEGFSAVAMRLSTSCRTRREPQAFVSW
jgi:ferredoxin